MEASLQVMNSLSRRMALHDAASDGDLEALRDRIERGDHVDGRGGGGNTPLMEDGPVRVNALALGTMTC